MYNYKTVKIVNLSFLLLLDHDHNFIFFGVWIDDDLKPVICDYYTDREHFTSCPGLSLYFCFPFNK